MTVYRGWQGELQVGNAVVAQVEGWSMDVDNSTEAQFAIGSRSATDITVGPKNVTGSFSKVWFDDTYSDLAVNPAADANGKPLSFTFVGQVKKDGIVSVSGTDCIWSTWSGSGESDGYATEDLDFICKNCTS